MGALASIASVVGAGASIYGNVRQAQQAQATNQAQVQVTAAQNAARQQELLAQSAQEQEQRRLALSQGIATERARLAAEGISPDGGSAGAVAGGMVQQSATAQAGSDAVLRTKLAQGQYSLLAPDNTATTLLQNGPALGYLSRSLLT